MRLRLGWYCVLLPGPGLHLRPGDEGPLVPRDRHPVQPPRTGSQVEEHRGRCSGRRVDVRLSWRRQTVWLQHCGRIEKISDTVQLRCSAHSASVTYLGKESSNALLGWAYIAYCWSFKPSYQGSFSRTFNEARVINASPGHHTLRSLSYSSSPSSDM